jgi:hypothetical protein
MTVLASIRWIGRRVAQIAMLVGAALATTWASATEPDFVAAHARAVKANPRGVDLAIGLVARHAQFRVGELIPLDLVYTFDPSDAYLINDELARGSGTARLLEVFRVSPQEGTRQLTSDEPNFYRWVGGTPREAKSGRVYRYRVYLNEWRRFDNPGKYRFYSTSARVWKPNVFPKGNNELRVTSNLLELEILPATTQWRDEQLRAAVRVLDRPDDNTQKHRSLRREALRRLRYLGTEAATRELARRYPGRDEGERYDIGMGTYESQHKPAAVTELERRLDEPDFVVTKEYLSHLAGITADAQDVNYRSAAGSDQVSREERRQLWKQHLDLEEDLCVAYFDPAWTAAQSKEPLIRARSLFELFRFSRYNHLRDRGLLTPERMAQIRTVVRSVFEALPSDEQELLLSRYWKQLGGVEFLPALRRFIAVAPERGDDDRFCLPIDWAFRRFLELAPDDGRALFLAELRRVRPRFTLTSVNLLPDEPIPELDDSLITRLEQHDRDSDLATALLARYGSAAIYDRARKYYGDGGGRWTCAPQDATLAYFLRHDPEEGTQLVNQALDAREQTGCYKSTLSDVAKIRMTAALEKIAIERIDDKDPIVVWDALRTLQWYGSAAAERALWRKFEQWHDTWKNRLGELTVALNGSRKYSQVDIENWFITAIADGRNWIADPPKLKRLRKLCLTEEGREHVDYLLGFWRQPITIGFQPGSESEFVNARELYLRGQPESDYWHVGRYSAKSLAKLKKLLARFPAGTTFTFPTGMLTDPDAEERLFTELQREVASHDLKLVKAPPRQ